MLLLFFFFLLLLLNLTYCRFVWFVRIFTNIKLTFKNWKKTNRLTDARKTAIIQKLYTDRNSKSINKLKESKCDFITRSEIPLPCR